MVQRRAEVGTPYGGIGGYVVRRNFLDYVEIVGKTPGQFNGTKKYVSTGAVDFNVIEEEQVEYIDYENKPSRANLVTENGDILFAKMQNTKKILKIDYEKQNYIFSTGFFAVRPRKNMITRNCLYHLLCSEYFLEQKDKNCSGATQKALTNAGLSKININIPDLEVQNNVTIQLDKIDFIMHSRKQQLSKLDELVKARFVEMFGTLDNPIREFRKATLKELCTKITDGKHGGCTQEEGTERYFVGAKEIYDDQVHYDTAPEINIAEFEKDYKRCNVEKGDFLIVNTGATIGKSAIAVDSRTEHTLLQKSVALLKVKCKLLTPVFLQYCYKINKKMYKVESSSAQPNLLISKINATEIYVPDITLQNQFTAFVEQTEKSKSEIQKSLEKLEMLKKALMQKYFG